MQNKLSTDHVMRVTFAIWKPINLKLTVFYFRIGRLED